MNRTLIALWVTILGAVVTVVVLGELWAAQREQNARSGLQALLAQQLIPYNRDIARVVDDLQRKFDDALGEVNPNDLSGLDKVKELPQVGQVVVVSAKGQVLAPRGQAYDALDESLIGDAVLLLRDQDFGRSTPSSNPVITSSNTNAQAANVPFQNSPAQSSSNPNAANQNGPNQSTLNQSSPIGNRMPSVYPSPPTRNAYAPGVPAQNARSAAGERSSGWTTWYHQRGLVLSYWMRYENQSIAMVIVPRGRWLSDIVSNLPNSEAGLIDTDVGSEASPAALSHSLIQLRDVEGSVIYQWGDSSLSDSEIIDAEIGVTPPLEGWRFRLILSPESRSAVSQTQSRRLARFGTAGLACALLALGILTTVNLNRQMRIAAQQVTFVNQVSHELRTPLTNIRMVADLASASLHRTQIEDELNSDLQRLTIIQQEAGRLGRLVENVLAFARAGRNLSPLHIREVDVESTIDEVLRSFEPQLSEQHMEVIRMRGLSDRLMLDRDVLEQILVNLISNAIKYAAIGKQLTVTTCMQDGRVEIEIADQGPGIPRRMRSKVFQPFVRLSHRLEDPAGTGIGLTIVRQLAKRHGGDCRLQPSAKGCRFVVTLKPQLSA